MTPIEKELLKLHDVILYSKYSFEFVAVLSKTTLGKILDKRSWIYK